MRNLNLKIHKPLTEHKITIPVTGVIRIVNNEILDMFYLELSRALHTNVATNVSKNESVKDHSLYLIADKKGSIPAVYGKGSTLLKLDLSLMLKKLNIFYPDTVKAEVLHHRGLTVLKLHTRPMPMATTTPTPSKKSPADNDDNAASPSEAAQIAKEILKRKRANTPVKKVSPSKTSKVVGLNNALATGKRKYTKRVPGKKSVK